MKDNRSSIKTQDILFHSKQLQVSD